MSHAAHPTRTDTTCRNCGTPAPLAYCPACGQDTAPHPPTLWEFLHEFVGHYVAFEGKLWRTLRLLVARPGALTAEYLAGRKARYVLPLRVYLSASFVFFIALKLGGATLQAGAPVVLGSGPVQGAMSAEQRQELLAEMNCPATGCPGFRGVVVSVVEASSSETRRREVGARMLSAAPYLVFALVPVYAAWLKLVYRRRRMRYGEHLVFAFHLHAFAFLALLVGLGPGPAAWVPLVGIPLHGVLALRRVYGGGWWATLARAVLLSLLHGLVLVGGAAALALQALQG